MSQRFGGRHKTTQYPTSLVVRMHKRVVSNLAKQWGWRTYDASIPVVVGFDQDYEKMGGGSESYIRSLCEDRDIVVVDTISDLESEILGEIDKLSEQ